MRFKLLLFFIFFTFESQSFKSRPLNQRLNALQAEAKILCLNIHKNHILRELDSVDLKKALDSNEQGFLKLAELYLKRVVEIGDQIIELDDEIEELTEVMKRNQRTRRLTKF